MHSIWQTPDMKQWKQDSFDEKVMVSGILSVVLIEKKTLQGNIMDFELTVGQ